MNSLKPVMFAALAAIAFAAPALAQGEGRMAPQTGMIVDPGGRMTNHTVTDKMIMDEVIKNGKVISGAHIYVNHEGKMYMVDDHKMADGKMMSEHMRTKP